MAKSQRPAAITPGVLEAYDRLIATQPGVVRRGASVPYTSVNGNMSSYLDPSGSLVLRLPAGELERFISEHATTRHEAHGIVQKEYATVPAALLADTERLRPWFAASHAYVSALKPKPTRPSS